jgi:deoxycytidylate deaminase
MPILFKDGVTENDHPLNLAVDVSEEEVRRHVVDRIPLFEVYMRMAEELAKRSTCARLQVGTVITDRTLEHVLGLGYNGNARGFPNECDTDTPGACGCIHSEQNRNPYRKPDGLEVLQRGGVKTIHYVRWENAWR